MKNNYKISQEISENYSVEALSKFLLFQVKMREEGIDLTARYSKSTHQMKTDKLKRQIVELPGFIQTMLRYLEVYNDIEAILYSLPVSNKIRKRLETFTVK